MNIVVDTNILFSIIITPQGKIATIIETIKKNHRIHISDFSFDELSKHKHKLLALSQLPETEIDKIIYFFERDFAVISSDLFSNQVLTEAFEFVKDVDVNDLPIVAASLFTKSILLTGDKKLYADLKRKNFNIVCNTAELRELLY